MGARLKFAKVVDRDRFMRTGSEIRPGLENRVELEGAAPAKSAGFAVHREWYDVEGAFTESWAIQDPHGRTVHEGLDREVVGGNSPLVDEIDDLLFEYADAGYQLVLSVDGREVARVDFDVVEVEQDDEELT